MYKITVRVDGMMCEMCEMHVTEAIKEAFPVKEVTTSRTDGTSVILTDEAISDDALQAALDDAGYQFVSATTETCA